MGREEEERERAVESMCMRWGEEELYSPLTGKAHHFWSLPARSRWSVSQL